MSLLDDNLEKKYDDKLIINKIVKKFIEFYFKELTVFSEEDNYSMIQGYIFNVNNDIEIVSDYSDINTARFYISYDCNPDKFIITISNTRDLHYKKDYDMIYRKPEVNEKPLTWDFINSWMVSAELI